MKTSLYILTLFLAFACNSKTDLSLAPIDLQVEYGSQTLDRPDPRFSWKLNDYQRGAGQYAYQVLVATDSALLKPKEADVWNSGMIVSDQSVFVEYKGNAIEPGSTYYWTVRIWNQDERISEWAKTAVFRTGFFEQPLWKARWIGSNESAAPDESARQRSILLRKEFASKKTLKNATAFVTGLGSYQLFINGEKVSNDLLTPGWTDYPSRIMYQVYDVKSYLNQGDNALGIMLGNAWYSSGLGWSGKQRYSDGPLHALIQVILEYADGSKELIVSDESWTWHNSPLVSNTLYDGEVYDARLEIEGWSKAGLPGTNWKPVDVYPDKDSVILSAHTSPTIQVSETIPIPATRIHPLENGSYVFDMGKNMTGGVRLSVRGQAGTEISMKFAELLYEDGSVDQRNLRSIRPTDTYILKGSNEIEIYEPAFTYHGFRYVEVSGLSSPPDSATIVGLNYHNVAPITGSFSCSEPIVNQIQSNIINGQKSNMYSVPTDCPQRDERLGWMGDAQIFAATSCYNMDMSGFYAKWIRDIADSQSDEGWVTDVNPAIVVTNPAKPAWGDAFIVVPYELYRFYGDRRILEDFYPDYREWVEWMRGQENENGLYIYDDGHGWGGYGDWIAVESSPAQPISAAYYYYSSKLLSEFAEILGYEADYKEYSELAKSISTSFHSEFYSDSTAQYHAGTQTANLLPLNFGITPQKLKAHIAGKIHENIVEKDYHPTTGFLGTKYILPTLSDYGYHDAAYKTAIGKDYPSWGYMVDKGATSIWELWNSDTERPDEMNSRNHFALGSVGEWYYSHLAGIRLDENSPAFKHSIIAPMPAPGLDWVKASLNTPYGVISSAWERNETGITFDLVIPPNTKGKFILPIDKQGWKEVLESDTQLLKKGSNRISNDFIQLISVSEERIILEMESGSYSFTLKN